MKVRVAGRGWRRGARRAGALLILPLALPPLLGYACRRLFMGERRALLGVSQLVSLAPGIGGVLLREAVYRVLLQGVGRFPVISFGTTFTTTAARLGDHVYIGPSSEVGAAILGDEVHLGSGVRVLSGTRQHRPVQRKEGYGLDEGSYRCVSIGRGSWVGSGAIVGADVGEGCIVGAGAVCLAPVPSNKVVVGNPARVIRDNLP